MRLIDIDKHFESNKVFYEVDLKVPLHEVKEVLEHAPTVKAIPIEWIRGRLQKAADFTHNKAEGKFIDNGVVVEVVSASFTANVLLKMLEDWEKENELDKV